MDAVHLDMAAVHFSTRCGSACTFCYFSDPLSQKEEPTPLAMIERILHKISAEGVKEVLFVGGDPVVHPDFVSSLEAAKAVGLTTSVLSNSWAIRPQEKFERAMPLIDSCEATILGASSITHDALTQRPGSLDRLIENLRLVAVTGKPVGVCTNVTPQNLGEVYDTVKMVYENGIQVRSLMIQRIVPSGDAKGSFKFGLDLDSVQTVMEQVDRVSQDFGVPIVFEDPVPWCTVDPKYHHYLSKCQWGYTHGSINSRGQLNRCGADDHYRLGSIWDGNVQDIWLNHPILKSFRSKQYLASECQSCELLEQCGGGCPLSCGTMTDHSLDDLYIQRVQRDRETSGTELIDKKAIVSVRFAVATDLPEIVQLEAEMFSNGAPVFTQGAIERCFRRCPEALMVAYCNGVLVGYAAIFPVVREAISRIESECVASVIHLPEESVAKRFSAGVAALYLEVIAVKTEAPFSAKRELLKALLDIATKFSVPIYTHPVSDQGMELARNAGFHETIPDSGLYIRPAPLAVLQ